ncbi:Succinate-semialdehyde dehydrogenase [Sphingobium chlorophenolicum L-1]|uniref:Succinate-semialdehyde dehydrogenase n=1 Tax=Sphingobium chlorophenolicum L-1 TaxID=690566 RepID=F6EWY4_SPHCR|nr:NAD-dependent succinate-semialdehyde dehydrogenase [Sphingobium chlorophenolicum]AEG48147.1 Succinate-semialdehyde dehydrogenase [Sphingobium chlorophenolicum L-1]
MATTTPDLARPEFLAAPIPGREGLISVDNPATGEKLGEVPALDASQVEQIVTQAKVAQRGWGSLSAKDRAARMHSFFDAIIAHQDDLSRLMVAEQGKPLAEAKGEVAYAASFVSWFADEGLRAYGEVIPAPQADKRILVLKRPIGLAAAVTPWNFPLAMITRKVAPALAAGCGIVVKPSELTPFSAMALQQLAIEAGIPEHLFAVVTGHAKSVGPVLTGHPDIAKFSFTGSTAVGKLLTAQCASTMKRVSMELGGNAPLIVFDDADIDMAVEGTIMAKFRNSGQTCVCANRILVQDGIHDKFVEALTARAAALRVGNGLDGVTEQGPLITEQATTKVAEHVADAIRRGAKATTGGTAHEAGGRFWTPTVLTGATSEMRLAYEETFGPVAPVFRFRDEREALAMANDTRSGLAAYAFSADIDRFWRVCESLEVGMIGFNTGAFSSEVIPFGGVKESGLGREGSKHGLDEYLELRMICLGMKGEN